MADLATALDAMPLHSPVGSRHGDGSFDESDLSCALCAEDWPCPTSRLIAAAGAALAADAALRAVLRDLVDAIGNRTFVLNDGAVRQVFQFGRGEPVSASTGLPLAPGEFVVNGVETQDPLVRALVRAAEIIGPENVTAAGLSGWPWDKPREAMA